VLRHRRRTDEDRVSANEAFAVSFLGALFAILVSLLVVYSYVTLRLAPKIKRGVSEIVEKSGGALGSPDPIDVRPHAGDDVRAVRVIFTCEDHGRCAGCPKVLAQFEAIVRHQGEASFDEVERKCYAQLRAQITGAPIEDEGEVARQRRIAVNVVDALVGEGFAPSAARGVVWSCGKEVRATFEKWLCAARESCQRLSSKEIT